MKAINPTIENLGHPQSALRQAQSVYKAINQGIEIATPSGQDSSGIYNKFEPGNQAGVMIRIGATGTTEQQYTWPNVAGNPLKINHGLLKQPIGFHVVDIDGSANIYRYKANPLDSNYISLATSDPSVNVTVFIF